MTEAITNKQRGEEKILRRLLPVTQVAEEIRKPDWLRIKIPSDTRQIAHIKQTLRENRLHTVCEEASCPNLMECFSHGTATFMIMGDKCTRRCSFCDVAHGKPEPLDAQEPEHLAKTIQAMQLRYVVITSVDRDDLADGGAQHFSDCLTAIRHLNPHITIEVLVPDFRGRRELALSAIATQPPDVFNHNIETVPRLYKQARPGSDYQWSLQLLLSFKQRFPHIPTKSGIMLGLGETLDEVKATMQDLRLHNVEMLTLGQYLAPSSFHHPVARFVTPQEFDQLGELAKQMGFTRVASGPLVRSSYHADQQAAGLTVS